MNQSAKLSVVLLVLAFLLLLGGIFVCWLAAHSPVKLDDRVVPTSTGDIVIYHSIVSVELDSPFVYGFCLVEALLIGTACWLLFRKRARRTSADRSA